MRSLLLAWAIALLYCDGVESFVRRTGRASGTPGFVAGAVAVSRKRPRGSRQGASSSQTPLAAVAGSFTARTAKGESNWLEVAGEGRRRAQRRIDGGHGMRMFFGLHFQPPDFSIWLHGTVQAVMLGGFAALIPKVTAERIREKEDGMDRDAAYESGLLDDEFDELDEYGYAGGYVCPTCDNTNEVTCSECGGKGFFVSASAMPKKCTYCSGLGTFDCEECEERREMLRRERGARRPPRELPPARGDDFPFGR
ncbi:unnamed protein product [Ectocarpus fasciculatus]